ncbi:hypothetical protein [Clostridium tagluense]|uniref:hypothetical protein n=1 Tax=Clostridium tagluense TaxID=360422 RepID=UPI001C0D0136|nr:hypothetical protein [Clostridium tagluense]MBU3128487.1 hypothetical protein [Clostridium tagluense]
MSNMFFDSEKEQIKFDNKVNSEVNKYLSRKNNEMECMIEGCNKHAVNSHAISKMSSLAHISEGNNLLSIKSQRNSIDKELKFKLISYNDATTFKGFCIEHEKLFENLDYKGICSKKDLLLQCYRNVCHAYFFGSLTTIWHPNISNLLKSEKAYTTIIENLGGINNVFKKMLDLM